MIRSAFLIAFLCSVACAQGPSPGAAYSRNETGLDASGNIYVGSDKGSPIKIGPSSRCLELETAKDHQTMACTIARGNRLPDSMQSQRIEIYLRNGKTQVIETRSTIAYWHFWGVREIAVDTQSTDGNLHYALYDAATGMAIKRLETPADPASLPQWAKTPIQIEDESVPADENYSQQVTKWIAKAMRQIKTVKPGMERKELEKLFTPDGGVSVRSDSVYRYSECSLIKVRVQFKTAHKGDDTLFPQPDDVIVSISQPYLDWEVLD